MSKNWEMSIDFAKKDGIRKWLACEESRTKKPVVSNPFGLGSLFLDGKEPLLAGSPAVGCLLPVLKAEASQVCGKALQQTCLSNVQMSSGAPAKNGLCLGMHWHTHLETEAQD